MEKKPEVDGKWVEAKATELVDRFDEILRSEITVLTFARIELAGADREHFHEKLRQTWQECGDDIADMDNQQKSNYVLRKMLLS